MAPSSSPSHHNSKGKIIQNGLQVDEKNYPFGVIDYGSWLTHFGGTDNTTTTTPDDNQLVPVIRRRIRFHRNHVDQRYKEQLGLPSPFLRCIRERKEDLAHILKRELTYIKHSVSIVPNNPAAWNYLHGILQHKYNSQPFSTLYDGSVAVIAWFQ